MFKWRKAFTRLTRNIESKVSKLLKAFSSLLARWRPTSACNVMQKAFQNFLMKL